MAYRKRTLIKTIVMAGILAQGSLSETRASSQIQQATGTPLTISNPGFEADFTDPGCFSLFTPTGWTVFDPNGIFGGGDVVGALDPTGQTFFPAGAPEGINVGLTFLNGDIGGGPMGLAQVLGDTLLADTVYTLTVQVGDIASGTGPPPCDVFGFFNLDGFPGYQVQLLAGGVLLAQDDNTLAATLVNGVFELSTVSVTIGSAHPQLGQPLEIRLINLNTPGAVGAPAIEVDFDDVMLISHPAVDVPTMSNWGLVVMLLFMMTISTLVARNRRDAMTESAI